MKWTRLLTLFGVVTVGSLGLGACGDDDPTDVGPTPPPAVGSLSITVEGQTLTVSWTASAGATSYDVTLSAAGEADRTAIGVTEQTTSFSGLTPATTYVASVVARNEGGASAAATEIAQTDEEPETVVQVTGDILTNTTWTSDRVYVLNQPTFIGVDCGRDGTAAG